MLIVKMWHYFRGYVIIKIEGFSLEKFLNLVVKEDIFIWDIFRDSNTCLYVKVGKKDFKTLKKIIKKVSCRIEIIEKRGFPFIIGKMKRRKSLVGGATIVLILVYFLTSFIWTVEITGNKKLSENKIIEQLEHLGLQRGKFKYKLDQEEFEEKLLLINQDISYVNIEFRGTKVHVEIVEKEVPPPLLNTDTPTRVIAERDGIIHKILVYSGEAVVKEGDLVKKGDLLISGELQIEKKDIEEGEDEKEEVAQRLHASGDVYARTWYENIIEIPKTVIERKSDNEKVVQKVLVIGKKEKSMGKVEIPYEKYDKIVETTPLIEMSGLKLPVYIKRIEYYPIDDKRELTESEIKTKALEEMIDKIEKEKGKKIEISNSTMEIMNTDTEISRVKVFIEAIEKIGLTEEIQ